MSRRNRYGVLAPANGARGTARVEGGCKRGVEIGGAQPCADRIEHQAIQPVSVAKTHLRLGRMHVHIHQIRRQFEEQKRHGVAARHEQAAIGFLQGMAQAAVANPAAVEEQVLHLGVAALAGRVGDEAVQTRRACLGVDGIELVAQIRCRRTGRGGRAGSPSRALRRRVCRCAAASGADPGLARARRVKTSQTWPISVGWSAGTCGARACCRRGAGPRCACRESRSRGGPLRQLAAVARDLRAASSALAGAIAASPGRRRRSTPGLRRGSPGWRSGRDRRRWSACWWHGWRRPAAGRPGRCRSRHRRRGSARCRLARRRRRCGVLPASTLFSSSSLTTLAGRSMTSPAAILVMTESGSC